MSVALNRLVRKVKAIDKTHHKYKLLMMYDGETIAEYDMSSGERTIDMKTPEQWVRGCMVFLITLKGKDETKVEIKKIKVE
jgi:hypothetical protein